MDHFRRVLAPVEGEIDGFYLNLPLAAEMEKNIQKSQSPKLSGPLGLGDGRKQDSSLKSRFLGLGVVYVLMTKMDVFCCGDFGDRGSRYVLR